MAKFSGALDTKKVGLPLAHHIFSHLYRLHHQGFWRLRRISLHDTSPLDTTAGSRGGQVYIGYLLLSNTN